jgi:histidine triad (HIT) family protein
LKGCIFCELISGERSGKIIYEDDLVSAFHDIHPVAPTHILVVPKEHISSVNEINQEDENTLGRLFIAAKHIADQEGIADSGYRLIVNTGPNAGQVIFHLHLHLIGGQKMRFPMG